MTDTFKPDDAEQAREVVAWAVAEEKPLEIVGQGSTQAGVAIRPYAVHAQKRRFHEWRPIPLDEVAVFIGGEMPTGRVIHKPPTLSLLFGHSSEIVPVPVH